MIFHNLIEGNRYADERGGLNFFNSFNMAEIVRMYEIAPSDTETIRGWQGHRNERKWFYCNEGAFIVNLVRLNSFETPSRNKVSERFILQAETPAVLEISGGYATGFKAKRENSKLLVFSNFSLEESKADDFRYPIDTWEATW